MPSINVNENTMDRLRQLANDTMLCDRFPKTVEYLQQLLPPPQPLRALMEYNLPALPEMLDTNMSGMEEPNSISGRPPLPTHQAIATVASSLSSQPNIA